MKLSTDTLQNSAEKTLRALLLSIPDMRGLRLTREADIQGQKADLLVLTFSKDSGCGELLVEVKSSGEPRFARGAVNQLLALKSDYPEAYGVFMAPYISEASARICEEKGVGYADLSGNCRLNFGSVFIQVKGNPNRFSEKRELRSLFKPKSERILRALLCEPKRIWLTTELAESVDVSLGLISNVRKLLLEREWIAEKKRGIELKAPQMLLDAWRNNYQPDRNRRLDFYMMGSTGDIELLISNICKQTDTRYAFTGFSGAARYAPFTTYKTVTVYMDPPPSHNERTFPFKPVDSGANIHILSPYDEGVFHGSQYIQGSTVVSPVQCYLDLKNERARGEEAAEALLERQIKLSWP